MNQYENTRRIFNIDRLFDEQFRNQFRQLNEVLVSGISCRRDE